MQCGMAVVALSANVNYELHEGRRQLLQDSRLSPVLCKVCCCASADQEVM